MSRSRPAASRSGKWKGGNRAVFPLEPVSTHHELPTQFPNPFDRAAVHPLARRAAQAVQEWLASELAAPWQLDAPGGGKMFGVLVVRDAAGNLGYLRAFSGMLGGEWMHDGWAPPTFDRTAYAAIWQPGEVEMRAMAFDRAALRFGSATVLASLDAVRAARSNELLTQLQDTYHLSNARGEHQSLRALFAPGLPPGGAGDCAGPKLLAEAYRQQLTPVAMAEFWWGAPPPTGGRHPGSFYAACRGKCGPVLEHMLRGIDVAPATSHLGTHLDPAAPATVYEDEWLAIVHKPHGLLSVPGRGATSQDCVASRVRERYPGATGPMLVHRLDLDTSGLMLIARDERTYVALQRLFAQREITKRYVALLDGDVPGDEGVISLPLRVDADDRPRHIHDPEFGKPAVTEWRVVSRERGRTRVHLFPRTGRTHQLRVHAAHPLGLSAPIQGDRLYGRGAPDDAVRLHLHAELLSFVHPVTGDAVHCERRPDF
jgi:tRNA pseudouridine32 synthase / 23S rRNA pseudouridine746 synthase